jgi:hypothetical protein
MPFFSSSMQIIDLIFPIRGKISIKNTTPIPIPRQGINIIQWILMSYGQFHVPLLYSYWCWFPTGNPRDIRFSFFCKPYLVNLLTTVILRFSTTIKSDSTFEIKNYLSETFEITPQKLCRNPTLEISDFFKLNSWMYFSTNISSLRDFGHWGNLLFYQYSVPLGLSRRLFARANSCW